MADGGTADVAIIGGGIVGFAVAHFLAPHRNVVLIEAEARPGYHATGRSAAVIVEAYGNAAVRALTGAARRYLLSEQDALAPHKLLVERGQLVIASADRLGDLDALAADYADLGDAVTLLDGAAARALCPMLRPDAAVAALWEPGALDLDVDGLLQAFTRGARAGGVAVVTDARVDRIERRGEHWAIGCGARTIEAPVIVNAAGAWAGEVAALAGAAGLPVEPLLRTALLVDPPTGQETARWPFVVTVQEDVYFKPDAGRLMVSLADERPVEPHDAWAEELDIALAVERLQRIAEIEVHRVTHSWAGLRTFAPDRAPVIGWDPTAPGFCWAAAVGGFGVQTSPATGALVAECITGAAVPGFAFGDAVRRAIEPGRFA